MLISSRVTQSTSFDARSYGLFGYIARRYYSKSLDVEMSIAVGSPGGIYISSRSKGWAFRPVRVSVPWDVEI